MYDRDEYKLFRRCGNFLWAVRCHLHFSLTARRNGSRSTSSARSQCGFVTPRSGLRNVERFMKHYFLIAKDVGDLTAILCARLEDARPR